MVGAGTEVGEGTGAGAGAGAGGVLDRKTNESILIFHVCTAI
jgi:hypothetical protein